METIKRLTCSVCGISLGSLSQTCTNEACYRRNEKQEGILKEYKTSKIIKVNN